MKSRKAIRLAVFLPLLLLLVSCTGSITGYTGKEAVQGQVRYLISDRGNRAFASDCTWDLDPAHTTFDIAGEIEGSKVIALGGYIGTGVANPFVIQAEPAKKERGRPAHFLFSGLSAGCTSAPEGKTGGGKRLFFPGTMCYYGKEDKKERRHAVRFHFLLGSKRPGRHRLGCPGRHAARPRCTPGGL